MCGSESRYICPCSTLILIRTLFQAFFFLVQISFYFENLRDFSKSMTSCSVTAETQVQQADLLSVFTWRVDQCNVVSILQVAPFSQHGGDLLCSLVQLNTSQRAGYRTLGEGTHTEDWHMQSAACISKCHVTFSVAASQRWTAVNNPADPIAIMQTNSGEHLPAQILFLQPTQSRKKDLHLLFISASL